MLNLNNQYVVINGRDSRDFGIYVIDGNIFDFAIRDYETYQVPGRTGDLSFDHGRWKNITLTLKCAAVDNGCDKLEAWRAFLLSGMNASKDRLGDLHSGYYGSYKIETSIEPEIYRIGMVKSVSSPQVSLPDGGAFVEVSFDCSPKKYLKSGEESMDITMVNVPIINPTYYAARPLIEVKAYDDYRYIRIVNTIYDDTDYSIHCREEYTIYLHTQEKLVIDCETKNVTKADTGANYNNYVSLSGDDFPRFIGKSALPQTYTQSYFFIPSLTEITIKPRWWTL